MVATVAAPQLPPCSALHSELALQRRRTRGLPFSTALHGLDRLRKEGRPMRKATTAVVVAANRRAEYCRHAHTAARWRRQSRCAGRRHACGALLYASGFQARLTAAQCCASSREHWHKRKLRHCHYKLLGSASLLLQAKTWMALKHQAKQL